MEKYVSGLKTDKDVLWIPGEAEQEELVSHLDDGFIGEYSIRQDEEATQDPLDT